jgi:hypothetical protein
MRTRSTISLAVLLLMAFASSTPAQEQQRTSLRGSWAATMGTRPALQGTWSAELRTSSPEAAQGTWTLLDARGNVTANGTWSASRTPDSWSGTWSARASSGGRTRSGTWRADVKHGPSTFADLLRSTIETQLSGSWRSGGLHGRWSLRASR